LYHTGVIALAPITSYFFLPVHLVVEVVAAFVVWLVIVSCAIVSGLFWKVTVSDKEIHKRTLLMRTTIAFQDIKLVEITRGRDNIKLVPYSETERRLSVLIKATKYNELIALLKEKNIPGADALEPR